MGASVTGARVAIVGHEAQRAVLLSEHAQLRLQTLCRIAVTQRDGDVGEEVPLLEVQGEYRLVSR